MRKDCQQIIPNPQAFGEDSRGEDNSADEAENSETREAILPACTHLLRLDAAMLTIAPEFSRNYLQQLIKKACVRINGIVEKKPSHKVKAGQTLTLTILPTAESLAFLPDPMSLHVVFEDEHLLVINKAAGLVAHPAPGNWRGTLLNGLLARDSLFSQVPRAGIVHRLDKDTSGLMLVAKTRPIMDALISMIAQRDVHREYVAVAHGPWRGEVFRTVDAPIGRDFKNRLRMAVVDLHRNPGKEARTDLHLLQTQNSISLVRCVLHTGRTHQIRVHMAHIGHPLVGDSLYGGRMNEVIDRQALHAVKLSLAHPVTGEALKLISPMPADIDDLLARVGMLGYQPS